MSGNLSEEKLIAGIIEGSNEVLKYLYSNNFPKAKKLVDEKSIKGLETKDLFHEALIILIENVRHGKFKADSKVETYLMSIVKFKFYEQLRKSNRQRANELSDNIEISEIVSNEGTQSTQITQMVRGLKKMTGECEKILTGFYYENLSLKELATQMNYTDAFVRVKKSRCIKKLRESITK